MTCIAKKKKENLSLSPGRRAINCETDWLLPMKAFHRHHVMRTFRQHFFPMYSLQNVFYTNLLATKCFSCQCFARKLDFNAVPDTRVGTCFRAGRLRLCLVLLDFFQIKLSKKTGRIHRTVHYFCEYVNQVQNTQIMIRFVYFCIL